MLLRRVEVTSEVVDAQRGKVVLTISGQVVDQVMEVTQAVIDGRGGKNSAFPSFRPDKVQEQ